MLTASQIKRIRALATADGRLSEGLFIVEGTKIVLEWLDMGGKVDGLYVTETWLKDYGDKVSGRYEINQVSPANFAKISQLKSPQGVLATIPLSSMPNNQQNGHLALALEGIQNPSNLGAIWRIADWFGLPSVALVPPSADLFAPKSVQATMGAVFRVAPKHLTLNELQDSDQTIVLASMNGAPLQDFTWPEHPFLVIGNEGQGLSDEIRALPHHAVHIPRLGGAESLNAAVATGILVHHFFAQRGLLSGS